MSIQTLGAIYTVILLGVCFLIIHALRLAAVGYRAMRKRDSDKGRRNASPSETEEKGEPVYYIVERKKKRLKTEYSDPKRFTFK